MKKELLLVLMLIAAVVVMPRVYAAGNGQVTVTIADSVTLTIADNTASDTKQSGTSDINVAGDVITITYNNAEFKLLNGNGGNRTDNKAWIGFSITFPTTGVTKYTLKNEKTGHDVVTNGQVHDNNDSVVNVYTSFDATDLKNATDNATNVVCTYKLIVTTSSGDTTKTIKVVIAPKGITLKAKDEDSNTVVWNNAAYQAEVASVMSKLYNDLDATISVAKGYDFSKYTDESVKAVKEAIEAAEAAGKDLTTNNQAAVIALRNAITTAIANLVEKVDEPVKPGSTTTDNNKPGEQAPNTFDAGLTYVGLALSAVAASVVSIKKLRNN